MYTLAIVGFVMILIFMYVVMSKKTSAMVGLILVPIIFAMALGFTPKLGSLVFDGIKKIAPIAIMNIFAIMYFGVMIDAGLFDRLIKAIQKASKGDPVRILVGVSILSFCVSLDGDGTTTYMVTCTAMVPILRHFKINMLKAATIALMTASITNILPWGGPTARVMSILNLEAGDIFVPLIPAMMCAVMWALFTAYHFGKQERKRLGYSPAVADQMATSMDEFAAGISMGDESLKRPRLIWFNFILTVLLLVGLIADVMPLAVLFMLGTAIALIVNYPNIKQQQACINSRGQDIISVVSMLLAAGTLTGIMSGTKMIDNMAQLLLAIIPPEVGPHLGLVSALASLPMTFFLSNDAVYFGIMPVIVKTAAAYGISAAEIGRALLVGQAAHLLSPMVASTYLLVNLTGVNYGDLQKNALLWANGSSVVMLIVVLLMGLVPF